jgi:type VI secretion system secreted protein Hcp
MKTLLRTLFLASLLVALGTPLLAQNPSMQVFLSIPGIAGESQQPGHQGEIDVFAFNLGVNQLGVNDVGGGAGAGRSRFRPLVIHKNIDAASTALFLACATGKTVPKVIVKCTKDTQTYMVVTLSNTLVSSYNIDQPESDGTQAPLESISLSFEKIEIQYVPKNPLGGPGTPVTVGFDGKTNKKL